MLFNYNIHKNLVSIFLKSSIIFQILKIVFEFILLNNYLENRLLFPPHPPPFLYLRLDLVFILLLRSIFLLDERLDRFFIVRPLNNFEKKPFERLVVIIIYTIFIN